MCYCHMKAVMESGIKHGERDFVVIPIIGIDGLLPQQPSNVIAFCSLQTDCPVHTTTFFTLKQASTIVSSYLIPIKQISEDAFRKEIKILFNAVEPYILKTGFSAIFQLVPIIYYPSDVMTARIQLGKTIDTRYAMSKVERRILDLLKPVSNHAELTRIATVYSTLRKDNTLPKNEQFESEVFSKMVGE